MVSDYLKSFKNNYEGDEVLIRLRPKVENCFRGYESKGININNPQKKYFFCLCVWGDKFVVAGGFEVRDKA